MAQTDEELKAKVEELADVFKAESKATAQYVGHGAVMVKGTGEFSSYNVNEWYNKYKYLLDKK